MSKQTEALKLALEGLEKWHFDKDPRGADQYITAIREALAEQPAQQDEYGYAKRLAEWLWQKHYAKDAPDWVPFDNLAGVLTQIDNMVCRLVKEQPAPVAEPVAYSYTSRITGAQGFSHHPMPRFIDAGSWYIKPLYTSPPAPKPWVGMTEEERNNLWRNIVGWGDPSHDDEDLMKAIEAKLKEKNGT